jgi:hypothetical protein
MPSRNRSSHICTCAQFLHSVFEVACAAERQGSEQSCIPSKAGVLPMIQSVISLASFLCPYLPLAVVRSRATPFRACHRHWLRANGRTSETVGILQPIQAGHKASWAGQGIGASHVAEGRVSSRAKTGRTGSTERSMDLRALMRQSSDSVRDHWFDRKYRGTDLMFAPCCSVCQQGSDLVVGFRDTSAAVERNRGMSLIVRTAGGRNWTLALQTRRSCLTCSPGRAGIAQQIDLMVILQTRVRGTARMVIANLTADILPVYYPLTGGCRVAQKVRGARLVECRCWCDSMVCCSLWTCYVRE